MINSQIYHPEVSVILPVFNAEKYLAESIKSILNQSFTNFELIIINDGSTDKSSEIIKSFSDIRIVYIEQLNMGLANTLNKGVSLAKGKYIARQDNDDISYPERFQKQFSYLENNAEIALIGTRARIVNEMGEPTGRNHLHPTNPNVLKLDLLFDNPFVHSSIFVRKDILLKVGGYYSSSDFFEDYNLWSRISYHYKVANLPEILLDYREVNTGMSKTSDSYSKKVFNQCVRNFNYYFPESVS
ncbi:MAG: glycosyltransferase, partial [Bacteroidota bacterium]